MQAALDSAQGSQQAATAGELQHFHEAFKEIAFLRLSDAWMETQQDAGRWGGRSLDGKVFHQFQLKHAPLVRLDFWFRGRKLHPIAALSFHLTLSYAHTLKDMELELIREALGVVGTGVPSRRQSENVAHIHFAEVGNLNGRFVLAVRWDHLKLKRQYISVFIDADGGGAVVHEIHFSAPPEKFAETEPHLAGLLRSIQWAEVSLPPLSIAA